jgi:hypothetical protein
MKGLISELVKEMESQRENHNDEVSVKQIREAFLKGPYPDKRKETEESNEGISMVDGECREVSFREIREAWLKGPTPNKRKKEQDAKDSSYQVTYSFKA